MSYPMITKEAQILLDMLCLEKGIIQLQNVSSEALNAQFESLPPEDRRVVHRKIRKMAKKAIRFIAHQGRPNKKYEQTLLKTCGLAPFSGGSIKAREQARRTRIVLIRRMLLSELSDRSDNDWLSL